MLAEKQTVVSVAPEAGRQKIMRYLMDDAFKKSLIGVPPSRTAEEFLNLRNVDTFDIQQKGFQKQLINQVIHKQHNLKKLLWIRLLFLKS